MKITDLQLQDLKTIVAQGQKIFAIKKYRAITGADLMTSKLFIDGLIAQNEALNSLSENVEGHESFNHQQLQLMSSLVVEDKKDAAIAMYMRIKHDDLPSDDEFKAGVAFINQLPKYIQDRGFTIEKIPEHKVIEQLQQQLIKEQEEQKVTEQVSTDNTADYALNWLADELAPKFLNNFLDTKIPLMDKSQFVPVNNSSRATLVYNLFFSSLLVIASYNVITGIVNKTLTPNSTVAWVLLFAFPTVTLFFLWKTWETYQQNSKINQAKQKGQYRQGLFVLKEGLLLHTKNKFCYLPKESISEFKLISNGRHEAKNLDVYIQKSNGSLVSYRLDFLNQVNSSLHKSLYLWHKTGHWEFNS
jgi:hypothetical protein